ncbi:hypothetical protein IPA_09815 [Ignicoccus pacificus DSM 13166]|uniref:Uncharacterized protein n=1 Tax=Ignicoccus pacificus DSM 13166 TaxID=940294 RepID=A0A977KC22_9CREN|nr:hypothetical protein IPA_09815 [Ignicoccus pacificus DSM 13166]
MIVSYCGLGKGIARLYSIAMHTIAYQLVEFVSPIELAEYVLPYNDVSEVVVFCVRDENSLVRICDVLRHTVSRFVIFHDRIRNPMVRKKMKTCTSNVEIEGKDEVDVLIEMYAKALRDVLNRARENPRARLLEEDLKEWEKEEEWIKELDIEIKPKVTYTPSMELPAYLISKLFKADLIPLEIVEPSKELLVLGTSAEEHWVRPLLVKGAKGIILNLDPLVAPLYVLKKIKAMSQISG